MSYDATIRDEMARCQWKPGDECFTRIYGNAVKCAVKAVDIPLRSLVLICADGIEMRQYMESCWKE